MSIELILTNGRIYTMETTHPQGTAVAIGNGRIVAVGSDNDIKTIASKQTTIVDLAGRCVTPGLVDAHVHFQHYALSLQRVNLDGAPSLDNVLERITERLKQTASSGTWLQGRGWAQGQWREAIFPTAAHLDQLPTDRPIYLTHKSGHAAWVNHQALRRVGINRHTPDPPGGEIQRDAEGEPTGILFEEAMKLVSDHIPRATVDDIVQAMRQAQIRCWQGGLTGLHDFDGRDCFLALQQLHQQGELGLRVVKNIPVKRLEHAVGVGLQTGFGDAWLRIGGIKIFADGALGPMTAAMLAPYENAPDNTGIVVTDKEEMMAYATKASKHGLSVTIHAIGDRANHDVLDVYEAVRHQERSLPHRHHLRHRIEHVQIIHPEDIPRLAELNVTASMQPIHATSDMQIAEQHWGERAKYSYAWRTLKETGATLVFGSDAPIEAIEPLPGIHAAVTRQRVDGSPGPDGWYPAQRLTMSEAIHGFTLAAAITSGQEQHLGSIAPGKLADLTIFDQDIFAIPATELPQVKIAGTIIGGEFKYRTW